MSDVPRPLKQEMPRYREIEDHLLSVIYEKYLGSDLTAEEQRMMKQIDNDLLWYDLTNLLEEPQAGDAPKLHITLDYTVGRLLRWNRSIWNYSNSIGRRAMREDKNENRWDKLLQIHTMGRDDSRSDLYRYPYEPTPYCVLERMANTGMIRKGNTLLDYGCGKGRVDFFLSAQTGASPSVWSMMTGFMRRQWKTKRRRPLVRGRSLCWRAPKIFPFLWKWTGCIFLTRFRLKS